MEDEVLQTELRLFKEGKVDIFKMAAKLKTYRELLLMAYKYEVNRGLKRLEDLPEDYKEQIWQETKKDSRLLNKEQCKELAKIVYLISSKI